GCGTSDEIRREGRPRAQEPLFVWSALRTPLAATNRTPPSLSHAPKPIFPQERTLGGLSQMARNGVINGYARRFRLHLLCPQERTFCNRSLCELSRQVTKLR